jgi:Antitoxin VbhA
MQRTAVARNGAKGAKPGDVRSDRERAVADAEGLLRAEGLQMSPEHQALAARWVAGEMDSTQLEQLGLDLVRQRTTAAATR